MTATLPINLTRAHLPETVIQWYQNVTRHRFVLHVLPRIQWTVASSQNNVSALTDDERRSEQVYYTAVRNIVPPPDLVLSERCMRSYEINALTMLFAFAILSNHMYGRASSDYVVDLTIPQAIAMHQANGLCDALLYIRPTLSEDSALRWFAFFYHILVNIFQSWFCSSSGAFVIVATVLDIVHHIIHWVACCWRFGLLDRQFGVLAKKTEYHLCHWGALLVTVPNRFLLRDAWLNTISCRLWRQSHYAELQSHVRNPRCCIRGYIDNKSIYD